jgi:Fe-S cluster biogenesis protein NfuA
VDERQVQERVARVEQGLAQLEALPDPHAREAAVGTVQALLELYREGLARLMERLEREGGRQLCAAVAEDDLVAHLLLLHDLHPVDVHTRVLAALAEVRPYLQAHQGNVELLAVEGGVVRLRLQGSCRGCPASAMTLKLAIEEAILKAAPDVERVEAVDAGTDEALLPPQLPVFTVCPTPLQRKAGGRALPVVPAAVAAALG